MLKVVGLNPSPVYLMDIFHIYLLLKCKDVYLKRPKLNDKRGWGWPISFFKKIVCNQLPTQVNFEGITLGTKLLSIGARLDCCVRATSTLYIRNKIF